MYLGRQGVSNFSKSPGSVSCNGLDHEARVSTLINPATGWWDYTLVRDVFNTEDTTKICSMVLAPLSKRINWCRLA